MLETFFFILRATGHHLRYVYICVWERQKERHTEGDRMAGWGEGEKQLVRAVLWKDHSEHRVECGWGRPGMCDKGTEPGGYADTSTAGDCTVPTPSAWQSYGFWCSRTPGCPPAHLLASCPPQGSLASCRTQKEFQYSSGFRASL